MNAVIPLEQKYSNKRILITQNQLINFAGSEIVTLEIAEYFSKNGAEVIIATNSLGDPMMTRLSGLSNTEIYVLPNVDLEERLDRNPVDFAWIHHQLMPRSLFSKKSLEHTKYVFHHMSPYHPTEFPVFSEIEANIADAILFNSPETERETFRQGVLADIEGFEGVLGNPSPDIFLRIGNNRIQKRETPKKILIISNHIVPELMEARDILQSRGLEVETYGAQTDTYKLIEPSDFYDIDVVVTIGKTVQYAILYGVPVYCYDHFGGPGYIVADNYDSSRERNFSGRNGEKKDANTIVEEILEQYTSARIFFVDMNQNQVDEFRLPIKIDEIYQKVMKHRIKRRLVKHSQIVGLGKVNELNKIIQEILRSSDRDYHDLEHVKNNLEEECRNVSSRLESKEVLLERVLNSVSYRVGRFITSPLRFIRYIFMNR